jgi:hypothetical protein
LILISLLLLAGPGLASEVNRAVAEQLCARPTTQGADVVVCGNRQRDERFRMPGRNAPFDPDGNVKSVAREHMAWGEGGETGTQSCGPVGPGGWTGCMVREWDRQNIQTQYGKNRPRKY